MIAKIERELSKVKTHIIDYASIKSILVNMGYANINDKINHLKQYGVLKPIKKGLYFHSSIISNNILSKEVLANTILGPSYISLEYALAYHGLIPESVHQLTSVTTKRSKEYHTEVGLFTYKQIRMDLYSLGLKIEQQHKRSFIMATKEKAICDMIYLRKGEPLLSQKALIVFLEDDLRIDLDDFSDMDIEVVRVYYQLSKSKQIAIFLKLIENL